MSKTPQIRDTATDWKFMNSLRAAGVTQEDINQLLAAPAKFKVFNRMANEIGVHAEQMKAYTSPVSA